MKTNEIYLLHFSRPYKHAKHYLGSAVNAQVRFEEHKSGSCDVNLLRIAKAAGIDFVIAKVWPGDRNKERHMKGRGLSALCPICRETNNNKQKAKK
jgi:hypothetical protein